MSESVGFEVRDFRDKSYFITDDVFLNGFARELDRGEILVYLALCRHSDSNQSSFPSISLLAKKLGLSEVTVKRSVKGLEKRNMIAVVRDKGRHNVYYLLDKKVWRRLRDNTGKKGPVSPMIPVSSTTPVSPVIKNQYHPRYPKDKEEGLKDTALGMKPIIDFWLQQVNNSKGFQPELPKKDFAILSRALKKHGQARVKNILLFFLDSEKAEKYISMAAALSADTINQYNLAWKKVRYLYSDGVEIPTGEEVWWR